MLIRIAFALFLLSAPAAAAQTSYSDGRGGQVAFPLGEASFADEVVSLTAGSPAPIAQFANADRGLGAPDYRASNETGFVSLGCGGSVIYRFADNALTDIAGADLFVFEIGPRVEPTVLAISGDGETWIEVGRIAGATAAVDISSFVAARDTFSYVRLTDARSACSGRSPGADIDAVGAIGAAQRVVLDSGVLFEFNSDALKAEAHPVLMALAQRVVAEGPSRVIVEGHTDSVGADAYNQGLSERRAAAVRAFLIERGGLSAALLESVGYGEARPAQSNDSDAGRAANRRVEVMLVAGAQ